MSAAALALNIEAYDEVIAGLDAAQMKAECLELIFDRASHPLVVGDSERWHIVSECFAASLGYSRSELESLDWRDLVADEQVLQDTQEALSDPVSVDGHVMTYKARDGSLVSVEWSWTSPDVHGRSVASGKFVESPG